jgi:uncharacterized Zn finger protein
MKVDVEGNLITDKGECPICGEKENLHSNLDYSKPDLPIENILCNECGTFFKVEKDEK